jgi:protein phosphatase
VIPAERAHLNVTAISHPGMTGKNNEDRYGVSAYTVDDEGGSASLLAVVADGIGGHRAGEVAAEVAVETISTAVAQSNASRPVEILREAVIRAGQIINGLAEEDPNQKGMGSTCACAWIIGSRLYTVSVGDSRIYLIRGDSIRQLTTDHTWVQEAIDHGILNPEDARSHPNAHVIRRYLGSRQEVVPDFRLRLHPDESDAAAEANQGTSLMPGDILLLSSDGLTDLVGEVEILAALRTRNTYGALEELVKMTNRRGGHDNVTILTLAVPLVERATIPVTVRQSRERINRTLALAGLLGLVVLVLAAATVWVFTRPDRVDTPATATPQGFQATLFPQQATLPAVQPPTVESPASPATETETAGAPAPPVSTPLLVTLTPWPTNTLAP